MRLEVAQGGADAQDATTSSCVVSVSLSVSLVSWMLESAQLAGHPEPRSSDAR